MHNFAVVSANSALILSTCNVKVTLQATQAFETGLGLGLGAWGSGLEPPVKYVGAEVCLCPHNLRTKTP